MVNQDQTCHQRDTFDGRLPANVGSKLIRLHNSNDEKCQQFSIAYFKESVSQDYIKMKKIKNSTVWAAL